MANPPPRRYGAVIFDLFGTLVKGFDKRQYTAMQRDMADLLHIPLPLFQRAWWESYPQRATGAWGSVRENIVAVVERLGVTPNDPRIDQVLVDRMRFIRDTFIVLPEAEATLAAIRERGYPIGLISDCSPETPAVWTEYPLAPYFTSTIFSCSVGLKKPDPRIFALACRELQVEPAACLYIGDGGSHELTGAAQVGMTPVLITGGNGGIHAPWLEDARDWRGTRIDRLPEVLDLIEG